MCHQFTHVLGCYLLITFRAIIVQTNLSFIKSTEQVRAETTDILHYQII